MDSIGYPPQAQKAMYLQFELDNQRGILWSDGGGSPHEAQPPHLRAENPKNGQCFQARQKA
jgi:hypothetical protein